MTEQMIIGLGYLWIGILDIGTIMYFMHTFFVRKVSCKTLGAIFCLALAYMWYVNVFLSNVTINGLTSICLILLFTCLYCTTTSQKLLSLFSLSAIFVFSESLGAEVVATAGGITFTNETYHVFFDAFGRYILMATLSKCMGYLLVYILGFFFKKKKMVFEGKKMRIQYIALLVVSLMSYAIIVVTHMEYYHHRISLMLCFLIYVAMIIINVIIYALYYQVIQMDQLIMEKRILKEEYFHKLEYYHELEKHQNEIRKIRHDLKNKLLGILAVTENQKDVREQIENIMNEIVESEHMFYTENAQLNLLLNAKMRLADEKKIHYETNIKVPSKLSMNTGDLGVLVGNLLDNAIEAASQCMQEERNISFQAYYYQKCLVLMCTNSIAHPVITLDTSKEDTKNHGIGLKSVDEIIERYSGKRISTMQHNRFVTEINIWLQ